MEGCAQTGSLKRHRDWQEENTRDSLWPSRQTSASSTKGSTLLEAAWRSMYLTGFGVGETAAFHFDEHSTTSTDSMLA